MLQPADSPASAPKLLEKPSTQWLTQNSLLADNTIKENSLNTEFLMAQEITLFNITMNTATTPQEFHKEQRSQPDTSIICCHIFLEVRFTARLEQPAKLKPKKVACGCHLDQCP